MAATVWPRLDDVDLAPTLETLHLWSQVVGKVRLALTPWENHGWHVPFYLTPRGFATGLMQVKGLAAAIEFDLIAAALVIRTTAGEEEGFPLELGNVADFHRDALASLRAVGIDAKIDAMPCELPGAEPFDGDRRMRSFDPDVARRYWRALVETQRVFQLFRTRFSGKVSPIHLFWGAFDLAVTRFSGREAPPHPGGAPHLSDAVMREAYSREVSSAGLWPNLGSDLGPCFYSYAYPVPDGYADHAVSPAAARFDTGLGEFVLPYSVVQASADADAILLDFMQTTYEAAAGLAGWNRPLLERDQGVLGRPPADS